MKEKHQSKKLSVILVAAFIVFSMVISIFAIVVDNQAQGIPDYNDYSFTFTSNGYKTKIAGKHIEFRYYPADLENINISSAMIAKLQGSEAIGFAFNPEDNLTDNLAYIDLMRYEMESQLDKPVYFGVTKNSTKYQLAVADCNSATEYMPMIIINASADTGFYDTENPNCMIMNARLRNLLAAKDRLVYSYYGVMK